MNIYFNPQLLSQAHPDQIQMYCEKDLVYSQDIKTYTHWLTQLELICVISYVSSIIAQLFSAGAKSSVSLDGFQILFQLTIVFTGIALIQKVNQ